MGYRDDFYIKKNIIGHTGNIKSGSPSIYFHDRTRSAFGCVTTFHIEPRNIGRETVMEDNNYLIFNSNDFMPILYSSINLGTPVINVPREYEHEIQMSRRDILNEFGVVMIECFQFHFEGLVKHIARHPFIQIRNCSCDEKEILYKMVTNIPNRKVRYWDEIKGEPFEG
ncbi:MAG: hypothetical protein KAH18_03025 [Psychromonas sp.]|nr:hypothetical protein [Psychromonas sp.]